MPRKGNMLPEEEVVDKVTPQRDIAQESHSRVTVDATLVK